MVKEGESMKNTQCDCMQCYLLPNVEKMMDEKLDKLINPPRKEQFAPVMNKKRQQWLRGI